MSVESERIEELEKVIVKLCSSLKWMVDNDETNEGDEPLGEYGNRTWNNMNEYWITGKREAIAALDSAEKILPTEQPGASFLMK